MKGGEADDYIRNIVFDDIVFDVGYQYPEIPDKEIAAPHARYAAISLT